MVKPRALILRVAGTNCDLETEWAFKMAGARPERIHINSIVSGEVRIADYQILAIPGGFSYGDDIGAGKVLSNELKYKVWDGISRFIEKRKPIIGICNGFQVLAKSGILPWHSSQEVTLAWNDSGSFEDRWVYLKVEKSVCPFTEGLPEIIRLPVAHAEGKFICANERVLKKIQDKKQIVFRYVSSNGKSVGYPFNPNGSEGDVAGICDSSGVILGMMPHPERCLLKYHYPDWTGICGNRDTYGFGFRIFQNAVKYML